MEIVLRKEYLGHTFELTLKSSVDEDLSKQEVEPRVMMVLNRELQRCAEIIAVGVKDKAELARVTANIAARRARGEEPTPGPSMVLAAGTKAPEGRVVLQPKEG